MTGDHHCGLHRRTVLGAIAASGAAGSVGAVSGQTGDRNVLADDEGRRAINYVDVEATSFGTASPADVVPTSIERLTDHEQTVIGTAKTSDQATMTGEPTFAAGTIVEIDGAYEELSFDRDGSTELSVPTLEAERVDYRTMDVREIPAVDDFEPPAASALQLAIGRARYLHRRIERADVPDPGDEGSPHYVFDPHEPIPEALEPAADGLLVEDGDEWYRISLLERSAPVPTFEVEATRVADDADAFDEWFTDEHVAVDGNAGALSTEEHELLETASADGYSDQTPYGTAVTTLFDRLDVPTESSGRAVRWTRINGELHYVSVTQSIGC